MCVSDIFKTSIQGRNASLEKPFASVVTKGSGYNLKIWDKNYPTRKLKLNTIWTIILIFCIRSSIISLGIGICDCLLKTWDLGRSVIETRDGQTVGIPIPIPEIPKFLGILQNSQKKFHSHSHSFPWEYWHSHGIPKFPRIPSLPKKV